MVLSAVPHRLLFWLSAVTCVFSVISPVSAQSFSPLGPSIQYDCIKFPSGKFGAGLAIRTGYDTKDFSFVRDR